MELLLRWIESDDEEQSQRARIVLLGSRGKSVIEIGGLLGIHPSDIRKWIDKFNVEGTAGLMLRKKVSQSGARPRFTDEQLNRILEVAGTDPGDWGFAFKRWTPQKLADAAVKMGIVSSISHVTVRNILRRQSGEADLLLTNGDYEYESNGKPPSQFEQGMEEFNCSRYESAVECFYEALASEVKSPEDEAISRAYLSEALEELSRYDEAHEVIRKYEEQRLIQSLPPRIKARMRLRIGWVCVWLQEYPKAIACLNEALKLFAESHDSVGMSEVNYSIGYTYVRINEFGIAKDYLVDASRAQKEISDRRLLARIYDRLGAISYYEGSLSDSKENYLKALEFASNSGNANLIGTVLLDLGTSCIASGELVKAHEYLRSAIASLHKGGRKDRLILAYNNLGDSLRREGEWDEAVEMLNRAVEIAVEHGKSIYKATARDEATARITLGEILCARGRFEEAEGHLQKSLGLPDSDRWLESGALRVLSSVHSGQGQNDVAIETLRRAMSLSASIGDVQGVALAQVGLAELEFLQGRNDQAKECLEMAQGRVKDEEYLAISGFVQRITGQIEAAAGRLTEARQHIAQSISIFTTVSYPYEMARSYYEMGCVLKSLGEFSGAESNFQQAIAVFEKLGAGPYSAKCYAALVDEKRSVEVLAPNIGSPSDILLMQRLIEASAARDLLVREIAVIIRENFAASSVMVFQVDVDGVFQILSNEGVALDECYHILQDIRISLDDAVTRVIGGQVLRLGVSPLDTYLYIGGRGSLDIERLQPFLKQAELCLETCTLRMAARRSAASPSAQKIQTVISGFIVGSPQMFDVIERIHKIRTSDVTVLITGESGTGKELIARAIHAESARSRSVFLPFNCTATPKDIIDSQLFGHRRGAFTGATANYPGIIRAAEGGTLFLDEIGDLSLEVQPKLMRFLQEGEIQPLGETRPIQVDVRILAATNIDLERAVDDGRFREDLFHRLNIIRIHIPPLRERREEISILATHFLEHFVSRSGKQGVSLTHGAVEALKAFDWPGNVRQLRNEIERAVAYASDSVALVAEDFSPDIARPGLRRRSLMGAQLSRKDYWGTNEGRTDQAVDLVSNGSLKGNGLVKLKDAVAQLERRLIEESLGRNKNNLTRTAQELGLSRRGLRLKLGQLGINKHGGRYE